jgi:hypothetical protein
MTVLDYTSGTKKEMGLATANVVNIGDKTSMEITLNPGFNWVESVSPLLPGCPKSCPANHFGFLKSGTMKVHYDDGTTATVNAGESYLIPPGHLPEVVGDVPWYVRRKQQKRSFSFVSSSTKRYFSTPRRTRSSLSRRDPAPHAPSPWTPPRPSPQRDGRVLPVHRRRRGFHEEVSDDKKHVRIDDSNHSTRAPFDEQCDVSDSSTPSRPLACRGFSRQRAFAFSARVSHV